MLEEMLKEKKVVERISNHSHDRAARLNVPSI
jgi:hypothetical protein